MSELLAVGPLLHLPKIAYLSILPVLVMLGGALLVLMWSSFTRRALDTVWVTSLTVLTASASLVVSLLQYFDVSNHGAHVAIGGSVVEDGFSAFVATLVSGAVLVAALVADGWLQREGTNGPEMHVLMLVSASGAIVMAAANDLIVVFLGLEIMSIALYVLAAMNSRREQSGEAALKYFILGGLSSAIFLYGIALVYGATGTTNLGQLSDYLARNVLLHNGLLLGGLAMLLMGFAFKVAAVPFHLWTPDVYQGSPSPVTGFMAAIAKIGGFAALLRVFVSSFATLRSDWQPVVWVIAAATLLLGAVVALVQRDIKRMLAYSSINHAGFVLLGLEAADHRGVEASLYYLFVYSFMVLGSFAVVTAVGGRGDGRHDLENYRGLFAKSPWLAGALAILLMAQAGIPATTGLWAKIEVIDAAVRVHSTALAVVAMVSAVIAAFFYLRVIFLMVSGSTPYGARQGGAEVGDPFPDQVPSALAAAGAASSTRVGPLGVSPSLSPEAAPVVVADPGPQVPGSIGLAIAICVGVTVVFGLWIAPLTDFAHHAGLIIAP